MCWCGNLLQWIPNRALDEDAERRGVEGEGEE